MKNVYQLSNQLHSEQYSKILNSAIDKKIDYFARNNF
jgi:hypothetical protein